MKWCIMGYMKFPPLSDKYLLMESEDNPFGKETKQNFTPKFTFTLNR